MICLARCMTLGKTSGASFLHTIRSWATLSTRSPPLLLSLVASSDYVKKPKVKACTTFKQRGHGIPKPPRANASGLCLILCLHYLAMATVNRTRISSSTTDVCVP